MIHFERLCREYSVPYYTEGKNVTPGWINVSCPFHQDSNHMGFSPDGTFNCWKCGSHSVNKVISRLLHLDQKTTRQVLSEYNSESITRNRLNKKTTTKAHASKVEPPGGPLSKYHKRYLKRRNFSPRFITEKYGVLGTGPLTYWKKKDFSLRLIIPIVQKGRIVSFQGRDITDKDSLRYKGCPVELSVQHYKQTLYNIDNCPGTTIRLVEGITDVWRMGDGYACTFGTSMTDYQVKELIPYNRIYFIFDPEPEAQARAKKVAEKLAAIGKDVELIELEAGCDPGDLTNEQAAELRSLLR